VRLKQDKPSWGAPKIRERLARLYPDVHMPAISMVRAVPDPHVATIFSSRTWLTET
jgi:putative transposase